MKKLTSFIIIVAGICVFYACRKNDNPKLPEGIDQGLFPQLVQSDSGDVLIQDVSKFASSFSVDVYFKDGPKPKKMDIRVVYNDNYTNVKTLQADVTSFPATINVTGPQLAQLFGKTPDQVEDGDFFTIRPDVYLNDGKIFEAFKYGVNGTDTFKLAPYGSDAMNFPDANVDIIYTKVCPLYMSSYAAKGRLTVVDTGFAGSINAAFAKYTVNAALDPADSTTLILTGWGGVAGAVVKIKAILRTQGATVPVQVYAPTYGGLPYHNFAVQGKGAFNACDTSISLQITNTVAEGSFGATGVQISAGQ
ncbi:hypothetical protein [Chitinophaga sp. MM2321]|uniref:hypothetical protein n=1 Tax=Chitinophaga sp. MM2321 TaxID=3137178 RepID=UPI0032D56BF1